MFIHNDKYGALILAENILTQFTPHNIQYASKTSWFCEDIHKCGVNLKKIATMEQLRYIFNKVLARYFSNTSAGS